MGVYQLKKILCLFVTTFILISCVSCSGTKPKTGSNISSTNRSNVTQNSKATIISTQTSTKTVTPSQTLTQTQAPTQEPTKAPTQVPTPIKTATPVPTTKLYQNDNLSLKFDYPSKWTLTDGDPILDKLDYSSETFADVLMPFTLYEEGATEANGGDNFNITVSPALDLYYKNYVDTKYFDTNFTLMWSCMRAIYEDLGFKRVSLSSNEFKKVGDNDWVIFKYFCVIENKSYYFYQAMCVKDKVLITCTYTIKWDMTIAMLAEKSTTFNDILTPFKII